MRGPAKPTQTWRPGLTLRLAWGAFRRELFLPPALAAVVCGLVPAMLLFCLGSGAYLTFRDDMLASLMRRQASMQFAYEDRIAALRTQIDSIASRQMLNQDSFEGKMAELAVRQAKLESHSALLTSLAARVGPADAAARRAQALEIAPDAAPAPAQVRAPVAGDNLKPVPEGFDLRRAQPVEPAGQDLSQDFDTMSPDQRLHSLAATFDRIEQRQIAALHGLKAPAAEKAERLREAFSEAGLPVERMMRQAEARSEKEGVTTVAMGGPFVPAPSPERSGEFERAYASVSSSITTMDGLRRALPFAPLRQPLPGPLDVTSGFGYRTDPFLGRPALHTGMDFRGEYGQPVRATAAGRVISAGPAGGYGNMVEIDHGAGLSTRYGHLSRIDVEEGQWVQAGAELGAIGSTGRSTGPHLHYEVRMDGAPVDPSRYIKAGRLLNAGL